jgi:hypothetical protein
MVVGLQLSLSYGFVCGGCPIQEQFGFLKAVESFGLVHQIEMFRALNAHPGGS